MARVRESKNASPKDKKSGTGKESSGWMLVIEVKPGQSRVFLRRGTSDGTAPKWVVGIKEPPREGQANEGVLRVLAEYLGVSPSSISLVSGHTSRIKRLSVRGIDESIGVKRLRSQTSPPH
ncbi:MAG: DUF167 domain-containing protein [Leptospirillia bacterium]